jgi:hypothetical protein
MNHFYYVTGQPGVYFQFYFSKNHSSMNLTSVWNTWPGCCHNTCLWDNSELKLRGTGMLNPGQYLIADSGFPEVQHYPGFQTTPSRINAPAQEKVQPAPQLPAGLQ